MPYFNIIIPVYNVFPYLTNCVNSVLSQSFQDYEILLVNDGSNDGSAELCDNLAAKHTQIKVVHQKNLGLAVARNTGLRHANGEYILFMDSDDYYASETILNELYKHSAETKVSVLCFDYYRCSNEGTRLQGPVINYAPQAEIETDLYKMIVKNAYQSSVCIKLIRHDALRKADLWFQEGLLSEDVDFSAKLLAYADTIHYIPLAGYVYRVRKGSLTNTVSATHAENLLSIIQKNAELANRLLNKNREIFAYLAFQYCTLLISWRLAGSPCENNFFMQIRKLSYLLKCSDNSIVQIIKITSSFIGLRATSRLLQVYQIIKTRWII